MFAYERKDGFFTSSVSGSSPAEVKVEVGTEVDSVVVIVMVIMVVNNSSDWFMVVVVMVINFTKDFNGGLLTSLFIFAESEVLVMEDSMFVLNGLLGLNCVGFLLSVNNLFWVLNDEWNILIYCVLFKFIGGDFTDVVNLIWDLDGSGVVLPKFNNVWFIDGDLEVNLVPLGLLEFVLDVEWFFFVLGDWDLLSNDVRNLLNDSVVNSLSGLVGNNDILFVWNLLVNSVWNLLSCNIWDLVNDFIWDLFGISVWNLDLNFKWYLSINSVWDLFFNLIGFKGLNFVFFSHIMSVSNLVWNSRGFNDSNLLWDVVFLSHIVSDDMIFAIIRRIIGVVIAIAILSPLEAVAEVTTKIETVMIIIRRFRMIRRLRMRIVVMRSSV